MYKSKAVRFLFFLGTINVAFAATEPPLNGTVKDVDGNPVEGAELWVTKIDNWEALSGADGKYRFPDVPQGIVRRLAGKRNGVQPFFAGNSIHFTINEPKTAVNLSIYNLAGKRVTTVINNILSADIYNFTLPVYELSASTYAVALKIGEKSYVRTIIVQENGRMSAVKPTREAANGNGELAEMLEDPEYIDDLNCIKDGFEQAQVELSSYYGTVDVTMKIIDTIPPVIKILGGDTVSYAYQDMDTWRKYWDVDSFDLQFEVTDNSGKPIKQPSTNTLIEFEASSFVNFMYYAVDSSNNTASARRLIVLYDSTVVDSVRPILTVTPDTLRFIKGDKYYPDSGVVAVDSVDKHIDLKEWIDKTDDIQNVQERLKDVIFVDVVGTYTMTYRVMDTHMNYAEAKRTIIVTEAPLPSPEQ